MARLARVVVPGLPHLVRQQTRDGRIAFASLAQAESYRNYLTPLARDAKLHIEGLGIFESEIRLLVVPETPGSMASVIGESNRHYSRIHAPALEGEATEENVNASKDSATLWRSRFASCPMHLDYMETARAWVTQHLPEDFYDVPHLTIPIRQEGDKGMIVSAEMLSNLLASLKTGRPCGDSAFIKKLEGHLNRVLHPKKRGRKPGKKSTDVPPAPPVPGSTRAIQDREETASRPSGKRKGRVIDPNKEPELPIHLL